MGADKTIKKEKNYEKRALLHSVYLNNLPYAKGKKEKESLSKIIESMSLVDRKFFVLRENEKDAYIDIPLPIGYRQTVSQPTTVARMLLMASLEKGLDVLEVGSGSGWNSALISFLVGKKVTSIERIKELSDFAKNNLKNFDKHSKTGLKVWFVHGSALDAKSKVWKRSYDRIIVTAAAESGLANELLGISKPKLKQNGLLVFPTESGRLEVWKKAKGGLDRVYYDEGYIFVPLIR